MKIKDIKGYYLSSPYGNNKVFGQPLGVKSIGIVEVCTDNGLIGVGETYTGVYVPELIEHAVNSVKHLLIGKEFTSVETLYSYMEIPCVTMNGFMKSVIGAIEIALWDITSKVNNTPIYKLLSKDFTDKVRIYASGGSVKMTVSEIQKDVEAALKIGHNAYKMRVGIADWNYDLDRVKKARKTLGNDNDLMIDCIQGTLNNWDYETAKDNLIQLKEFKPTWVEEPMHPLNIDKMFKLNLIAPIAMGESLSGLYDYKAYINSGIDYINLDVTQCGGFIEAIKIIKLARKTGIKIALHAWGSVISLIANMNLMLAYNVDWMEIPLVELDINKHLCVQYYHNDLIFGVFNSDGLDIYISDYIKNKYVGIPGSGYNAAK